MITVEVFLSLDIRLITQVALIILPFAKWGIYSYPYICCSGGTNLLSITPPTPKWSWMKLSQDLYNMFLLCISYFRFWYESIWGFDIAKHGLCYLWLFMGTCGSPSHICYSLYTTEWNWMKLSQNLLMHLIVWISIQFIIEVNRYM